MSLVIGILLVVLTCAFAWWIVRIAGRNVQNFDESKHESFLGK
ncbi:hypothetical protein ACFQZT_28470 [Paenibacillus sp. GCM10027628]